MERAASRPGAEPVRGARGLRAECSPAVASLPASSAMRLQEGLSPPRGAVGDRLVLPSSDLRPAFSGRVSARPATFTQRGVLAHSEVIQIPRDRALSALVYRYGLRVGKATLLCCRHVGLARGRGLRGVAEWWQRSFIVARGSFEVRVRDLSRAVRTLRWDVSRLPYLRLPGGRRVLPIGHKLAGLSEPSVAVQGVLEVDLAAGAAFTLYPVFAQQAPEHGALVVSDGVGESPVR